MAKRPNRVTALSPADEGLLQERLDRFLCEEQIARARLWRYYSNPLTAFCVADSQSARPYRQGQESGLPARITGYLPSWDGGGTRAAQSLRKEIAIENDIAWRVDTMVDYLFGRPLVLQSQAAAGRREEIEAILSAIIERSGGLLLFQQMALLGSVYGFVDLLVTLDPQREPAASPEPEPEPSPSLAAGDEVGAASARPRSRSARPKQLASLLRVQVIDPMRVVPVTDEQDYQRLRLHAQSYTVRRPQAGSEGGARRGTAQRLDVVSAQRWVRYEDNQPIAGGGNALGRIPVVHIQNTPLPFSYSGGSDVLPLIPLQDELNTRLSDRAHRLAMTSMKMYLGRLIDGFIDNPPLPGRVWASTNPDAQITEVGGDTASPNELAHLAEVREALDKTSGVSPIAAGAVKGKIGHLTSAAALRITLMSLLARTDRKRAVYGQGIAELCELCLAWLDLLGAFATTPEERGIEIAWPSPLPENALEKLDEAKAKLEVGVQPGQVLRELGYSESQDPSQVD